MAPASPVTLGQKRSSTISAGSRSIPPTAAAPPMLMCGSPLELTTLAPPIRGVRRGGGMEEMTVRVQVTHQLQSQAQAQVQAHYQIMVRYLRINRGRSEPSGMSWG